MNRKVCFIFASRRKNEKTLITQPQSTMASKEDESHHSDTRADHLKRLFVDLKENTSFKTNDLRRKKSFRTTK